MIRKLTYFLSIASILTISFPITSPTQSSKDIKPKTSVNKSSKSTKSNANEQAKTSSAKSTKSNDKEQSKTSSAKSTKSNDKEQSKTSSAKSTKSNDKEQSKTSSAKSTKSNDKEQSKTSSAKSTKSNDKEQSKTSSAKSTKAKATAPTKTNSVKIADSGDLEKSEPDAKAKKTKKSGKTKKTSSSKITMSVIKIDTVSPGIIFKKLKIGNKKQKLLVHLIEADLRDTSNIISMLKAEHNSSELEKLQDMVREYDSTHSHNVVGAVNGSYWKAYFQYPIGPTIVDGEIVELNNRSSWQCAFFDENSKIYIDKFKLSGVITTKDKEKHILAHLNRRTDSSGIVLYNSFAGDTIPIVTRRSINSALAEALADSSYSDMTEEGFDTLEFKQFLLNKQRDSSKDNSFRKVRLEYLAKPAVNMNIPCRVLSIDTGIVSIPKNGCVLTIGEDADSAFFIKEFDIINLRYSTDIHQDIIFTGGLCGVPRLMAGGASRFEGQQKRGRGRFKYKELPRSGLGTSKDGKTLYLISASSSSDKYGIKGCTLENFAYAMKRLKIYDAINLDGGGSTVMVINGKGVMSCAECSRKISVGIGVARRKGIDFRK